MNGAAFASRRVGRCSRSRIDARFATNVRPRAASTANSTNGSRTGLVRCNKRPSSRNCLLRRSHFGTANDVAGLSAHPQLRRVKSTASTDAVRMPAHPMRASGWPVYGTMPAIGQHTDSDSSRIRRTEMTNLTDWIGRTTESALLAGSVAGAGVACDSRFDGTDPGGRCAVGARLAVDLFSGDRTVERTRPGRASAPRRISCRRCSCRGACGPVAVSSFSRRLYWASRPGACRACWRRGEERPVRALVLRDGRTRDSTARRGVAIREQQDIVYREASTGGAPAAQAAPVDAKWQRAWSFDSPRLFRYSALTFNSHKIHYDRAVCDAGRGLSGARRARTAAGDVDARAGARPYPHRTLRRFEFRAVAPVFDGQRIRSVRETGRRSRRSVDSWRLGLDAQRGSVTASG